MIFDDHDTIVAPATPAGGALCVIRLSGERAIELSDMLFRGRRRLSDSASAMARYGYIMDGEQVVDDEAINFCSSAALLSPLQFLGTNLVPFQGQI